MFLFALIKSNRSHYCVIECRRLKSCMCSLPAKYFLNVCVCVCVIHSVFKATFQGARECVCVTGSWLRSVCRCVCWFTA